MQAFIDFMEEGTQNLLKSLRQLASSFKAKVAAASQTRRAIGLGRGLSNLPDDSLTSQRGILDSQASIH